MGTFFFAMKMLVREAGKSIVYIVTLIFTLMTSFIFFNIINNQQLSDVGAATGGTSFQTVSFPISTLISFVVIVFGCCTIGLMNNLYLSHKTSQIGVMAMSGSNVVKTVRYLFYQLLVMSAIALPIGILLGTLLSFLTNSIMYDYLGITSSIYTINPRTYSDALITVGVVLGCVLVLDAGFVYTHDIAYMLNQERANELKISMIFHLPDWMYLLLAVGGIAMLLSTPYSAAAFTFPCFVGSVGVSGMMGQVFPHWLAALKKRIMHRKKALIFCSTLATTLNRSFALIMMYCVSTVTMISLMITTQGRPKETITTIIAYIVIIILLSVSLLYKYISDIQHRRIMFFNLYKLGYLKKELAHIIYSEVALYYGMLVLIPSVYIIILLYMYYRHQAITNQMILILLAAEMIPAVLMAIMTSVAYRRIAFEKIKGAVK